MAHALDEGDLCTHAPDRLPHLNADRSPTQDQQPARDILQCRRVAIRPDALELS